ncbi:MAG: PIN domain-containing protein [Bacteroidota bacterium]
MANVFDINKYSPAFNENLFFDNNVWVYLFCPFSNYKKEKQTAYAEFVKNAIRQKSAIFVNSIVLSEFCNYWLRTEFNIWKRSQTGNKDFKKDFTPTNEYHAAVEDVKIALNKILQIADKNNDDFNAISFDNVMSEFGNCDFNDSYYLELARIKKWKIVTEDADFFKNNSLNIDVITANV